MGERVYVVREGKVRGEGRYRASGIPAWTGGRWAPTIKDAFRFTSRSMAMRNARKCKGRPVRLVTIPEQLRRERARYNRLSDKLAAVGCGSVSHCACPCHDPSIEDPWPHIATCAYHDPNFEPDQRSAYARGRADERAAVVAWLRGKRSSPYDRYVADRLEGGEHVKGGG